jgi:hypothetical protein
LVYAYHVKVEKRASGGKMSFSGKEKPGTSTYFFKAAARLW